MTCHHRLRSPSEIIPIFSSFVGRLWVCFWGAINLSNLEKRERDREREGRSARCAIFQIVCHRRPPPDFSIEKRILSIVALRRCHQFRGRETVQSSVQGAWEKALGSLALAWLAALMMPLACRLHDTQACTGGWRTRQRHSCWLLGQ